MLNVLNSMSQWGSGGVNVQRYLEIIIMALNWPTSLTRDPPAGGCFQGFEAWDASVFVLDVLIPWCF